jgi:hypothetical protein
MPLHLRSIEQKTLSFNVCGDYSSRTIAMNMAKTTAIGISIPMKITSLSVISTHSHLLARHWSYRCVSY